ncbi:putative permease [Paenibacillus shirakamiensis]|uniref:Permease n=1 Tax=Paenibacillus shirakamiensis TaxID=1265935 RepID=A0ABS4JHM3_9BACL|nr:AEC family transporter [Paenibacillus shirakamiensis]MBP2001225.1 putative permease [Paenibacillus shirakamiensis]
MLQAITSTLFHTLVPLSIPVLSGALLKKFKNIDTKPLLTLYLYILSPAILLQTLLNAKITWTEVTHTLGFSLLNLVLLWAIAQAIARWLRLPSAEQAGLTLISTFTNSVNYGLPLILLAFGQLGLDKASVYVIGQMIIVNTIGVYFAARSQFTMRKAIQSVFALPAIYAAALALLLRALDLSLPEGIQSGVAMVAAAYSPVVLAILGAQMVSIQGREEGAILGKAFWSGIMVRLVLSPLVAALVLWVLNVHGVQYAVLLILASMPVAVNAVVLSERFEAAPQLVSRCILWTTLASFVVLPVLIAIVK